jgi:type IV pilus assembly protein PilC
LVQALRILVKQTTNHLFKRAISEIADEVEGGEKLSQALAHYPKIFSDFFVAMVRSGETSGRLDEVLNYLADEQEKDYDLVSKIKGAMIYPIFIVTGLVIVGAVMMIFVIPKLTEVLKESGKELPLSTRILIGTSEFMAHWWWLLIMAVFGIFFLVRYYLKTSNGRFTWDLLKIRIPIFGRLLQRIYMVRMSRSLATLMNGGVPLTQSLEIVSDVVGNRVYQDIIHKTMKEVRDGRPMTAVLGVAKEVPLMFSQMISVGEQTGKLSAILEKLGDFYSREVDNMVTNLVSLIEPLIMVVLGVAVGIMVAAIILPMYNMASSF